MIRQYTYTSTSQPTPNILCVETGNQTHQTTFSSLYLNNCSTVKSDKNGLKTFTHILAKAQVLVLPMHDWNSLQDISPIAEFITQKNIIRFMEKINWTWNIYFILLYNFC
jgi:hypothetical protein